MPKRVLRRLTFSVLSLSMAIVLSGCASDRTYATSRPSKSPAATAIASAKVEGTVVRTTAVLRPVTLDGKSPTGAQLTDAAKVLARRFVDAGRPMPTVTVSRDGDLRFSIPATMTAGDIAALVARDAVAFRTVLGATTANAALRPVAADSSHPGDLASDLARQRRTSARRRTRWRPHLPHRRPPAIPSADSRASVSSARPRSPCFRRACSSTYPRSRVHS